QPGARQVPVHAAADAGAGRRARGGGGPRARPQPHPGVRRAAGGRLQRRGPHGPGGGPGGGAPALPVHQPQRAGHDPRRARLHGAGAALRDADHPAAATAGLDGAAALRRDRLLDPPREAGRDRRADRADAAGDGAAAVARHPPADALRGVTLAGARVLQAFLTTLDFSRMRPKPSTRQSMSCPSTGSTRRMSRTLVPALMPEALPLTFRSRTTITLSPSASTLPTESRTTSPSDTGSSGFHSWPHIEQASSSPIS